MATRKGTFQGGKIKFGFRDIPKDAVIMQIQAPDVMMQIQAPEVMME